MEETAIKEKRRWRTSYKRILLFFLPFFVLAFSLFYFVLPRILFPLRIDPIPSGAYMIPWMRPEPSRETLQTMNSWSIDTVMADALKLNITFNIHTPSGTRVIPSTVYLGHDSEYLYIGGKFREIFANITPVSVGLASCFSLYLDVDNDGVLEFPECGSAFISSIWPSDTWRPYGLWYMDDMLWYYDEWKSRNDYYSTKSFIPPSALEDMALGYENSTGTLTIIFSRCLQKLENTEINRLQMRKGERWVMGFNVELRIFLEYLDGPYVDGWPMSTFPYSSPDSSGWPKLVIDLTNPPLGF